MTKTYYRPQNSNGPYYNPFDSVLANVPAAIKVAVDMISNEEAEGFREFLYEKGATPEGLLRAVKFYENYCDILLNHNADEAPLETFRKCGLPHDETSFLLFDSIIAGALLSIYHEALVATGSTEIEWKEGFIKDLKDFIIERIIKDQCQ